MVQKNRSLTIDLMKVHGDGKINCPKCGLEISPEDTSEENYVVLEPIMKGDVLEKLVLQCNKCRSVIELVGFNQQQ